MRVMADNLTGSDFYAAAFCAEKRGHDIYVEELTETRGRRRARSFKVYCESLHGRQATNRRGEGSSGRAASWTAWGWFIGELFRRDPKAIIGQYKSVEDFRRQCREAQEWRERYAEIVGHEPRSTMGADISFLELVERLECPNCGGPEGYSAAQGYHAVGCVHHPKGPDPIPLHEPEGVTA